MLIVRKASAEVLGTFWLVFGGVGSAVIAGKEIGHVGVALAFGLSVLTMAYAVGHISGAHLNPAVTTGLVAAGRFPLRDWPAYVLAQLVGGFLGALAVLLVARALPGYDLSVDGLGANGFGAHSPAGYSLAGAFFVEVVLTFIFLTVILGATSKRGVSTLGGGIAIGLCLTLVHLVGIPVTNTSVNPARSTGPAIFVGGWALAQLWLFWVAPLLGSLIAGLASRLLEPEDVERRRTAPRVGPPGREEHALEVEGSDPAPAHPRRAGL